MSRSVSILIYNSVLKCQHAILKSGASTPRTVTKFAVKTAREGGGGGGGGGRREGGISISLYIIQSSNVNTGGREGGREGGRDGGREGGRGR